MIDTSLAWWETAIRLVGAAGLGGLLGFERESDGQDAGFRTHLLLALGAALFAVTSVAAFDAYVSDDGNSNVNVDISRIASYVAAGVGFIGGGAILRTAGAVKGLTTAASLWTTAAIGVAAGLGFWAGAISGTIVALVALAALRPVGALAGRVRRRRDDTAIVLALSDEADIGAIIGDVRAHRPDLHDVLIGRGEHGEELRLSFADRHDERTAALLTRLASRADVRQVHAHNQPGAS